LLKRVSFKHCVLPADGDKPFFFVPQLAVFFQQAIGYKTCSEDTFKPWGRRQCFDIA
jgi:hypothetical protein